ncbi:hypothetical protein GCM10010520_54750 [Rhizobium viscosum]
MRCEQWEQVRAFQIFAKTDKLGRGGNANLITSFDNRLDSRCRTSNWGEFAGKATLTFQQEIINPACRQLQI